MQNGIARFVGAAVLAMGLVGCGGDGVAVPVAIEGGDALAGEAEAPVFDLAGVEIVDLTHALASDALFWPTESRGFTMERTAWGQTEGGWFYAAHYLSLPEHGGTHLDAPLHFGEGQQATDAISLDRLIGPAVVLDVSAKAAKDPDYRLTKGEVEAWEAEHGPVPEGALVLLHTGWSERWPDAARYFGNTGPGDVQNLHFPSYGEEGARYLVTERKVAALGVDTASIDHGQSQDFVVHRLAALANVPGLENLTALDRLPPTGALVFALPLKIAGGSGGPARVVALLPPTPAS